MKLSVIIPVYNVERFLRRCLDSVLAACEGIDAEVICIDDGSTDASSVILGAYADRVKIITKPNGGLSSARNAGLDAAIGDYVMFVDSDDWIPNDAVRKFLQVADESQAPVVCSRCFAKDVIRDARASRVRWTVKRPALKNLVAARSMRSSVCNKLFRRDAIGDRRFVEGIYYEDWPFVTELFGDIDCFAVIDEPMYVYCTNPDSASIIHSAFNERKAWSYMRGIDHVKRYFENHPMREYALKRCGLAYRLLTKRILKSESGMRDRLMTEYGIVLHDNRTLCLVAFTFWVIASLFCCLMCPIVLSDVVSRYAPMADAFAAGDWQMAFHPRFGVLFQVLSGCVTYFSGLSGGDAVQIVALAALAFAIIPMWKLANRLFGRDIAWWTIALVLCMDRFWSNAIDGLRDPLKIFAFALVGDGVVRRKPLPFSLGLFVLASSFSYGFAVAAGLFALWLCFDWRRAWLPAVGLITGSLLPAFMVYSFTGWFVPVPHFIKYLEAVL